VSIGDDAIADNEAEASPGANPFGGKKGFEYSRLDFRWYAPAVIHDFHHQADYLPRNFPHTILPEPSTASTALSMRFVHTWFSSLP